MSLPHPPLFFCRKSLRFLLLSTSPGCSWTSDFICSLSVHRNSCTVHSILCSKAFIVLNRQVFSQHYDKRHRYQAYSFKRNACCKRSEVLVLSVKKNIKIKKALFLQLQLPASCTVSWKSFWYKTAGSVCWHFPSSSQISITSWFMYPACSHEINGNAGILSKYGLHTSTSHDIAWSLKANKLMAFSSATSQRWAATVNCMDISNRPFYSAT